MSLLNCINLIAKSKGLTMEQYINDAQEEGYAKLKVPLGIYGKSILGLKTIEKNSDFYVPGLEVMTGHNYNERVFKSGRDRVIKDIYKVPDAPVGWWVSEKFDGQRAVWDGEKFISRGSGTGDPRVYPYIPRWFLALMPPNIALDGELFIARNSFNITTSILKTKLKKNNQEELEHRWLSIKYIVFDVINDELYEKRKEILKKIVEERCKVWNLISLPFYLKKGKCPLIFTEQIKVTSEQHLISIYNKLTSEEAEGVMIRAPGIPYIPRRTKLILKMKLEEDSDCVIQNMEDHKPGEGKYKGMLGSFYCKDGNKYFYVGGMNDLIRKNYKNSLSEYFHPKGTVIVYQFNGLTPDGIPRHPRYKGIKGI